MMRLDAELTSSISEKEEENKNLQLRIVELETENKIYLQDHEVVQKLALQPKNSTTNTTNNNNRINNNFFNDTEKMKQIVNEKLNESYVTDGQKGIAQFACDNLLKDEVISKKSPFFNTPPCFLSFCSFSQ